MTVFLSSIKPSTHLEHNISTYCRVFEPAEIKCIILSYHLFKNSLDKKKILSIRGVFFSKKEQLS